MNSASVDLIYLDPPFNSNRNYSAPIGSESAGAAFKDTWTLSDVDEAWHGEIAEQSPAVYSIIDAAGMAHGASMKSYLIMMAVRLLEMKRLLKNTGSIYLHCDPTASHYLKMLMDAVFGKNNFRREVIWKQPNPSGFKTQALNWIRNHDTVLYYLNNVRGVFNPQFIPYNEEYLKKFNNIDKEGRRYWLRSGRKRYLGKGIRPGSVWIDIHSMQTQGVSAKEGVGYPTQKPLALLDRIIKASSNAGDMVFDPFCGCATALVAADRLNRQWVGIDLSPLAAKLVLKRIRDDRGPLFDDVIHRTDIPRRTDLGDLPHYRTHKHTLFGKQEGRCAGCDTAFPFRNFTVDHIVPRSKGGHDHLDNLQLLCNACNSQKGSRSQEEFLVRLQAAGLRSRPD